MKSYIKTIAIDYRKRGYSYNEILEKIPSISKSTLSSWLRGIVLSPKQQRRLLSNKLAGAERGRQLGALANQKKAIDRVFNIQKEASKDWNRLCKNRLFIIGISLYWAEGSKKQKYFQFMNSDIDMIVLIKKWLKLLEVPDNLLKYRLYIHKSYEHENPEEFWMSRVNISKAQMQKSVIKKSNYSNKRNPLYKGCLRIEVSGSEIYWKTMKWIELLKTID